MSHLRVQVLARLLVQERSHHPVREVAHQVVREVSLQPVPFRTTSDKDITVPRLSASTEKAVILLSLGKRWVLVDGKPSLEEVAISVDGDHRCILMSLV
jgi:hypothetical protein